MTAINKQPGRHKIEELLPRHAELLPKALLANAQHETTMTRYSPSITLPLTSTGSGAPSLIWVPELDRV
jgi:hypothetical protein